MLTMPRKWVPSLILLRGRTEQGRRDGARIGREPWRIPSFTFLPRPLMMNQTKKTVIVIILVCVLQTSSDAAILTEMVLLPMSFPQVILKQSSTNFWLGPSETELLGFRQCSCGVAVRETKLALVVQLQRPIAVVLDLPSVAVTRGRNPKRFFLWDTTGREWIHILGNYCPFVFVICSFHDKPSFCFFSHFLFYFVFVHDHLQRCIFFL
jgi:hypothetical protein